MSLKNNIITTLFIIQYSLFTIHYSFGQQTMIYKSPESLYRDGLELYKNEKYSAAQNTFEKIINSRDAMHYVSTELIANSQYYIAVCSAKLFNLDAESLLNNFISGHEENAFVRTAWFELAKYQYLRKEYSKAVQSFHKVDAEDLNTDEQSEYFFKNGYSYFRINKFDEASISFSKVKDKENKFQKPALYYYSHIAYSNKKYQLALEGFKKLLNDPVFGTFVPYYIVQIYFLQNKYEELVKFAPPLLDSSKAQRAAEIAHLIGESYYRMNQYKECIPYLIKYAGKSENGASREDNYQLAYAYYKSAIYDKAIKLFEKVAVKDDSICQNANYHMADCYIKSGKKQFALVSFLIAYKLPFNKAIQEDALYNYAKLSYELAINPYNEAVTSIQKYIKAYPSSQRTDEMYVYLVNIYLTTKNYKDALVSIEGIKNKDAKMKEAYQKIAYCRALELFNNSDYKGSIPLFRKTISIEEDKIYTPQSYYWKAEAFYRTDRLDSAYLNYRKFLISPGSYGLPYYTVANYNIGYCYFKNKDYPNAILSLKKFATDSSKVRKDLLNDALLRIGDCYYINKENVKAIEFYNKAVRLKMVDGDYALYQQGLAYGVMNKFSQKVDVLTRLLKDYRKSGYAADAEYELANAYISLNDNENALKTYQDLLSNYLKSIYVKKTMLKIGLLQRNMNKDEDALATFKKVVTDYPGTPESKEALVSIRNIYVDIDKVNEFFVYVKNIPFANITNAAQDSITFVAAENKYLGGDCDNSVKGFADYIQKFPEGIFLTEANFYNAECEFNLQDYDKALSGYNYVLTKPKTKFTENALLKAAEINFTKKKDYKAAIDNYKMLEGEADYKNDIIIARTGLMRANFLTNSYQAAISSSRKLLETPKVTNDLIQEAHLTIAKSALSIDSTNLAKKEFAQVIKISSNEMAAESRYNLALIQFKSGSYEEAEKTVFELINQVPSYDYWIAKGFILLADNYVKEGNNFQAKQTLQSIIENYEGEDLKQIARDKLKEILDKEKVEEQKNAQKDLEIKFGKDSTDLKLFNEKDSIK